MWCVMRGGDCTNDLRDKRWRLYNNPYQIPSLGNLPKVRKSTEGQESTEGQVSQLRMLSLDHRKRKSSQVLTYCIIVMVFEVSD